MGKGRAIRTALAAAKGQFTIIQDADLEYWPEDYPRLLEPLLAGEAVVVYGSRYLRESVTKRRFTVFRFGVSLLNVAVRVLYGVRLTDEATCYKVFPTEVLRAMDLECERIEFCPEVTAKACRMGLRIAEVPVRYNARTKKEGKKIRWRDGLTAIWTLWKWRNWQPPEAARRIVREYKETQRVDASAKIFEPHSSRCVGVAKEYGCSAEPDSKRTVDSRLRGNDGYCAGITDSARDSSTYPALLPALN